MLEFIKLAFLQAEIDGCLQTLTDDEFYIYDHEVEKRCYVHKDLENTRHFTIGNSGQKSINFLAIDKCLLMDDDPMQRCDCAVFDEKTFCLIEIKATSSDKERRRAKCRKKASDQLKATIVYLKNRVDFKAVQIEAYITLVKENVSEDDELIEVQLRPRIQASMTEMKVEFDEIGVFLFYDNRKEFM